MAGSDPREERVLILAPTGRDSRLIADELGRHGFSACICPALDGLCAEVEVGAGAAVLAEEALPPAGLGGLVEVLDRQPPWSDLPLLVLTGKGTPSVGSLRRFEVLEPVANITQLERPVQTRTLVSAVRSALRARRRQYDVRDHLAERERHSAALRDREARLQLAVEIAHMGVFEIDLATDTVQVNEPGRDIYGWAETCTTFARVQAHFHSADRDRVLEQFGRALDPDGPGTFEAEQRIVRVDGEVRWIRVRGRAVFERHGSQRRAVRCVGTYLDVTDRKLADEAHRVSEQRLRTALTAARMVAWEWTPADGKLRVSENAADVFGLPAGTGLTGIDQGLALLHPDDVAGYRDTYQRAIDDQTGYLTRYRLVRPDDGRVVWIEERGNAVLDRSGGGVRLSGVAMDVSERVRAERELAGLAETLGLALSAADLGTWEWDPATDGMVLSRRAAEIYGIDPAGPHRREALRRLIHPDHRGRARDAAARAAATRSDYDVEYPIVRDDGIEVWVAARGRGVYDITGNLVRMIGVAQDVTERKAAEVRLQRSHDTFLNLIQNNPFGVYLVDADFRLARVSLGSQKVFAHVRPLLGRDFAEVLRSIWSEPAATEFIGRFRHTLATGEPYVSVDTTARRADVDDVESYDWRIERVPLPDGRHGVVCYFYDMTERRRSEDALKDADRRKDEFLALLAHELRNPLAPLRNGLQVIRLSADRDARERAQAMMDRQLSHMVRLIDDLLDVSRISRNKMELRRARLLLSDVVSSAIETVRPVIDAAGHELTVLLPAEPVHLDADLTRLAQVFGNLLSNSAKYTPPGGSIRLTAEVDGAQVVVTVSDNGIGIPEASLPAIFDMFSQVDRSIERSTGGLGIGLALVRGLVEMHGGTVSAASDGLGRGSTFTVRLPLLRASQTTVTPALNGAAPAAGSGRRVLVVDDNRDSAESMAELLKLLGYSVAVAHDGMQALEAAEQVRPDVVLMDVGMPQLNGLDATRAIRERPWGREPIIVALTGWGQEGDRARSREAGCNGHLVKPVSLADLQRLLGELV